MMITIIAGSRSITQYDVICKAVAESGFQIREVFSGHASGVDLLGEQWAREHGIPLWTFPADWGGLGKRAGVIRNQAMAENAEALIAIWDGKSKGTANMIEEARKCGLKVFVFRVA